MKKKLHRTKYFTRQGKKIILVGFAVLIYCCNATTSFAQQLGQWTFLGGDTSPGLNPNYGTIGVASSSNAPGARRGAAKFTDKNGNLYLYGGSSADWWNFLGDLWKWDGKNWTWLSGTNQFDQQPVYGTKGVAASGNMPGCRTGSTGWMDKNGIFWLFGGRNGGDIYNDLWKFDGTNWTWVGGSNTPNDNGSYGTKNLIATTNQPPARYDARIWTDAKGYIWMFGGAHEVYGSLLNDLWKWDGANWAWISGSNLYDDPGVYGTIGVPSSSNMPRSRSKPTTWTDKNGNFWVYGGFNVNGAYNDFWKWDGTYWTWVGGNYGGPPTYGTLGVADPTSYPGGRQGSGAFTDKVGNLWLFGGFDGDNLYNDMWKWDGTNWTWMGGTSSSDVYGTPGKPSNTAPGSRESDMGWTTPAGNFVIYGGWSWIDGYPPFLGDLWSFTPPTTTVLPVTLTNFTATKQGTIALLDWDLAMEQSIDRYWIERSSDGFTYSTIGSVVSNGNSSAPTDYSFVDSHPLNGAVYYRLRIAEKDGKTSYSPIRLLNFGNAINVVCFPNPVKTSFTVTGLALGMTVNIFNILGQPVLSTKATASTLEIKAGTMPPGIYGIRVVDINGQTIFGDKLVKE